MTLGLARGWLVSRWQASRSLFAERRIDGVFRKWNTNFGATIKTVGATDMGKLGIDAFLRSHKCNDVCRLLKLPENTEFVRENVGQLETSSVNTVDVSVVKTNHLVERQGQRRIADLEIQKAKKHGDKFRSSNGAIRHELADVCYVTTKDFKVGVTGIRLDNPLRVPPSARAAAPATTPVLVEVSIAPQWAAAAAGPSGGSQDGAPRAAASGRGGRGGRGKPVLPGGGGQQQQQRCSGGGLGGCLQPPHWRCPAHEGRLPCSKHY